MGQFFENEMYFLQLKMRREALNELVSLGPDFDR